MFGKMRHNVSHVNVNRGLKHTYGDSEEVDYFSLLR